VNSSAKAPAKRASKASTAGPAAKATTPQAPAPALTLLLIRHADAGDSTIWPGDDAARPLSKKGRRQSKRLGDLLEALDVRPDAILTSPRLRAADTAKLVGRRVGTKVGIDERIDTGFNAERLSAVLADLPPAVALVALVGHDPDFSVLASWLADAPLSMAKGALARIELPERTVGAGKGTLRWLLPPDAVSG
jgi:phosphohistidine phosphatase